MRQLNHRNYFVYYNTEGHNWKSCEELEESLFKTYRVVLNNHTKFVDLASDDKNFAIPDNSSVIIITHKLTKNFFRTLDLTSKKGKKGSVSITWYVFGNFANLFLGEPTLNSLLKNFAVSFVAASSAQAELIKFFLKSPSSDQVHISLLSGDVETFKTDFFREGLEVRKHYGIAESDFLICYAGRLSFQKNISLLMKMFSAFAENHPRAYLLLCGNFDDLGFAEIGLRLSVNAYQAQMMSFVDSLAPGIKKRIIFTGNLKKEELAAVFKTSDLYMSLSTYILEDFGLAPLQALLCGTPALLTDWGGFKEAKKNLGEFVDLVDVELRGEELFIDLEDIQDNLESHYKNKLTQEKREALGGRARQVYSVDNQIKEVRKLIQEQSKKSFNGIKNDVLVGLNSRPTFHFKVKFTKEVLEQISIYAREGDLGVSKKKGMLSLNENWNNFFLDFYQRNSKIKTLEKNILAEHWPAFREFSERYLSAYSFQIESLTSLEGQEYVLLRDGVLGINIFFSVYPRPLKKSLMKICLSLRNKGFVSIPKEWRHKIHWYDYELKKEKQSRTTLLIIANSPAKISKEIIDSYAKDSYQKIQYINGENDLSKSEEDCLFGTNIEFVKWGVFLNVQDFSDYDFVDLADIFYSAKNFTEDYLLDRNAKRVGLVQKIEKRVNLKIMKKTRASAGRTIVIYQEKG